MTGHVNILLAVEVGVIETSLIFLAILYRIARMVSLAAVTRTGPGSARASGNVERQIKPFNERVLDDQRGAAIRILTRLLAARG